MMDWQTLKQDKVKNVQEYTQEFRKRALAFHLYTQETLLKYIGGLHDYLKHTILMLNPTNLDEVSVQHDLGSDSCDETMITTMGVRGIASIASTSSSKSEIVNDKRNKLFYIRVITKHVKIDTLVDSRSQANLISKEVVKKLGLETKPHPRPYPLGWVCDNTKLQVTKQCKIRFANTSKFVDEVELDVVPLDICRIVLGSPYLYDRKAIFYKEENKYCFKKDGIEYIVRSHHMKTERSLANTR
jgi:hypothetical protein